MLRHLAADIESGAVDAVVIHDAARPLADASMFALPMAMRAQGKACASGFLLAAELEYLIARIAAAVAG